MVYFAMALLALTMSKPSNASDTATPDTTPAPGVDFRIPFTGNGKIVSVRANLNYNPNFTTQVFVEHASGQQRLPLGNAQESRWFGPKHLIHEIVARDPQGQAVESTVLTDAAGRQIQVLASSSDIGSLRASPSGSHVALARVVEHKLDWLEVHPLPAIREGVTPVFEQVEHEQTSECSHPTWSPDSRWLAVARWVTEPTGKVFPRLAIYDHRTGSLRRIEDSTVPGQRAPGGTRPLLWSAEGLFAYDNDGILRCDPEGSGCTRFHPLPDDRFIHAGVAVADGKALLLLRDVAADPFENRAVEVHELDLKSGARRLLVRTPPGVFLESLDWIADDGA